MDHHTQARGSQLSRRAALRLTAGLFGLAAAGTAVSGCGPIGESEPDGHPMQALYDAARQDVELLAAKQAEFPAGSAEAIALAQLGDARAGHRDKLAQAMEADGAPPAQPSAEPMPSDAAPPSSTAAPEPLGFTDLAARLDAAAQACRDHALGDFGYRRVLAASIGAACTAGAQVLLAPLIGKEG